MSVTAATMPAKISGKEYQFHPLQDKEYEEYENWLRFQFIQLVKSGLNGCPPEERSEILQETIKASTNIRWTSLEGQRIAVSNKGIARLAWMMAGKPGPFEKFYENFTNKDFIAENDEEFVRVWEALMAPDEKEPKPSGKK